MKVLVTGASGFVGRYLVPVLEAAGHDVRPLVRDRSRSAALGGRPVIECDLAHPLDLARLPETDAVVHLAQANVRFPDGARELHAVNTASTLDLLELARTKGARRFLYASSGSVYGFGTRPFHEHDLLRPPDFYATTKANAERLVSPYRDLFATTIVRLVVPYGPGQEGRMIPGLVRRVRAGEAVTLAGGGRPRTNPIYVEDVAEILAALLVADGPHVLNVAGDEPAGIDELANRIGEVVGTTPRFEDGGAGAPGDLVADNARLHEVLPGLDLVPLAAGLARTAGASAPAARR